jgi:uncharacterized protein YndB with AHSA1/START domain
MTDDIVRLIGAVTREVRNETYQGKTAKVVVASRVYDTDIDDLWDAITNGERLPRWFLPVEGDLKLGGKYQLKGNAGGTITRCEPPRELAMTWEFGGGVSWVEITLREEGEGTHLRLRHIAHPEEHWDTYGPGAVGILMTRKKPGASRLKARALFAIRPMAGAMLTSPAAPSLLMRATSRSARGNSIPANNDARLRCARRSGAAAHTRTAGRRRAGVGRCRRRDPG